jgi:hypothetical protein
MVVSQLPFYSTGFFKHAHRKKTTSHPAVGMARICDWIMVGVVGGYSPRLVIELASLVKAEITSIGTGKITVLFFSTAISVSVCR